MARKQWFGLENLLLASGTTVTASSANSLYPVANLQKFSLKPGWWSTGVSSEWVKADFGTAKAINGLFLDRRHNLTGSATVHLQLNSSDSWASPAVDEVVTIAAATAAVLRFDTESYRWARLTLADAGNSAGALILNHLYLGQITELENAFLRRHTRRRTAQGSMLPDAGGDFYLVQQTERLWRVEAEWIVAAADQAILDAALATALAGKPLIFCAGDDAETAETRTIKILNALDPEIENLGGGWRSYRLDLAEIGGGFGA